VELNPFSIIARVYFLEAGNEIEGSHEPNDLIKKNMKKVRLNAKCQ